MGPLSASLSSENMLLLTQQILMACEHERTLGYKSVGTLRTSRYIKLVDITINKSTVHVRVN